MLDFLANGMTIAEILADYPQLQAEDILACIAYGAELIERGQIRIYQQESSDSL
jgi:uncharacterized protein (DUF433 family)